MDEPFERAHANFEESLGFRLPNAPKSFENGDVGLKSQLGVHKFMNFLNQNLKTGKDKKAQDEKMIELLMMQGVRLSSSTKKLAKVYMPSTFLRFGKEDKMK